MESLKHTTEGGTRSLRQKFKLRRPWCISLVVAVIIVVIVVIVVPLAVLLPRRNHRGKPSTVLFPLYIYPKSNATWGPLYEAALAHPELDFVVVVNPQSGPGSSSSPSSEYAAAVRQLSTYSNVQKVGYVRTSYATRNITEVLDDVETYSDWDSQSSALAMDGIFFDEAPHQYTSAAAEYMNRINLAVKNATGIQGDRMVIHNPGTVPDTRLADSNTDVTVVFEQAYDLYQSNTQQKALRALTQPRSDHAYILHSVPTMSVSSLQSFINGLSQRAAYLFVTTLNESYYESFDPQLEEFCNVVPT
ncbi:hypothetical protein ARAM_005025 [Aspergillus rambellii]|uniref:Spherulin 4-like cell surface protein n=2 Tax=Aspergillus subgen. Nidulantes TaxID=2720870 RepID=A0A0F8UTZ4_9EURO|nr:hypothetical protein AOCH_000369 [Aspergillus ochraceoroseus]KKK22943.1 hypothetical protein ARAM_005025 [Aspergillus rambellii]